MIGKSKTADGLLYISLGLFFYMPLHIFISTWLSTYTGGIDFWKIWKDVLTALVTILCIAFVFYKKLQTRLYYKILFLTLIHGFIHLILFFTTDTSRSAGILGSVYNLRIFSYLIIGFSISLIFKKTHVSRYFFKTLIFVSALVCVFALAQYLLPKDLMEGFGYSVDRGVKPTFYIDDKPDLYRVFSTLRDPNSLGAFLILPIIYLIHSFYKNIKNNKKTLITGLLLLHILTLFLTFSRSTLLATFISVITLLALINMRYLKENFKKIIYLSLLPIIFVAGFVYVLRDQYIVQNLVFHSDESTVLADPNELRVSLFRESVDQIVDRPLGYGPGTAGLASIRSNKPLLTENYYLQILHEVGVFGLAIFFALIFLIVQSLLKIKSDDSKVLIASFVGLAFACMLFHTWSNEAVAISWFMLAGLIIGQRYQKTKKI